MICKKKIENLEFVQNVNLDFSDCLKNNATMNLLIFDNSFR